MARLTPRPPSRGMVDLSLEALAPAGSVIKAVIDGLDTTAREMERKWGVGRLRLLVSDELRIRFDAQQAKLDAAIVSDQAGYIRPQAEGMRRAWLALDKVATEAGAQPLSPEVWECVLPSSGEIVSIVRTETEAHHIARECEVWTLAEVAVLIDRLGHEIRQVKRIFPGAAVTEIRDRERPSIDWERGDEIPF